MDRSPDTLGDVGWRLDDAAQLVHLADPRQLDPVLANLDDELRFVDVDAVARRAGEPVRTDLGRAGVVERLDPELLFDPLARGRYRGAWFSRVNGDAQGRSREIDALLAGRLAESQRVGRRAHEYGRLGRDDRGHALGRRHRPAGQAERAQALGPRERRPEA